MNEKQRRSKSVDTEPKRPKGTKNINLNWMPVFIVDPVTYYGCQK